MSEFLTIDGVPEASLPAHASDGMQGDRVAFLEAGLLHVEGGRATFVRWEEILGVVEEAGAAHVLVPRRPPRPPWIRISASALGGDEGAVERFAARVRERGRGGGYREAVRRRRQGLHPAELSEKVHRREPVPGALEVPSTVRIGSSGHPLEGVAVAGIVLSSAVGSYVLGLGAMFLLTEAKVPGAGGFLVVAVAAGPYVGAFLGALVAIRLRRRWRAARDAERPRQRVLVLAPDGCVVGFRTGVRTLDWSEVGEITIGRTEPDGGRGLVFHGADGRRLGDLGEAWLDAPLELVVKVARTYREAAL